MAAGPPGPPGLWAQLPAPNRQRLVWVLSQVLQRHLPAMVAAGDVGQTGQEEGHDDAA